MKAPPSSATSNSRPRPARGANSDNAWDEARWLTLGALGLPFDSPDWVLDARMASSERTRLGRLLRRRIVERVPVAYLLGEAWFAGLRFRVDERVLIPRSPIAELIQAGFEPWFSASSPLRILDLCCGSGCIGIAAALRFADATVDISDISSPALALARENVALHGVEDRLRRWLRSVLRCCSGPGATRWHEPQKPRNEA